MAGHVLGPPNRPVVMERPIREALDQHSRPLALDQQRKEEPMNAVMCMNHPERPADETGTDYGPPLCSECAREAGLPVSRPNTVPAPRWSRRGGRPDLVTLCGSMRFVDEMLHVAAELTAAGAIVLAPFVVVQPRQQLGDQAALKARLDELHRRKIELSDRVIVVSDPAGYVGESTRSEIAYADRLGIPVLHRRTARPVAA